MEKIMFKFNSNNVDIIETRRGASIEDALADVTIGNFIFIIQNAGVNESGGIGMSKSMAQKTLDEYLETNDKEDLMIDITEALQDKGFLSRTIEVEKMREKKRQAVTEIKKAMEDM